MKSYCVALLIFFLSMGCASETETGILAGGALEAGIRGTVDVITGGLARVFLDEQDRKIMDQRSPSTVRRMEEGRPLTINDVIQLSEGLVSDDTIINYMRQTDSKYRLSQAQIRRMQNAGVSQRVVNYMIDTGYKGY